MSEFYQKIHLIEDPEELATLFLRKISHTQELTYPLNPFQMLVDEGVQFAIRDFGKLEGVYIPAENENDIPIVGINLNRPITRQRFTAAHELCHFFRENEKQICPIGSKSAAEVFADRFAAALLMPEYELRNQVDARKVQGFVTFDDVVDIAHFFGVSFEACLFRIAFLLQAIDGNTQIKELRKRINSYKPELQRKRRGLNRVLLYEGLIDSYSYALHFVPNDFASYVFKNNYIYNDSRLEGVDIDIESAAEIITDLRLKHQGSEYCKEENEAFLSIAGHVAMYTYIFASPVPMRCSVFDTVSLHQYLYSCFPYPEYGGKFRQDNTVVVGAKFEAVDYQRIVSEMLKLEDVLKIVFEARKSEKVSTYIKEAVKLHHSLTVIHPFGDGNGRTMRAFFNVMMVRNNLTPVYIKVEDRKEYVAALEFADKERDYALLYELFFKAILRTSTELIR